MGRDGTMLWIGAAPIWGRKRRHGPWGLRWVVLELCVLCEQSLASKVSAEAHLEVPTVFRRIPEAKGSFRLSI